MNKIKSGITSKKNYLKLLQIICFLNEISIHIFAEKKDDDVIILWYCISVHK